MARIEEITKFDVNFDPDEQRYTLNSSYEILDKRGVNWFVHKGFKSDGASIPPALQPLIGDPFSGVTAKASIVHDKYCKPKFRSRTQKETHRIFREIVLWQMKTYYPWWLRWAWQYKRAWAMWAAVRIYNRFKNPEWK